MRIRQIPILLICVLVSVAGTLAQTGGVGSPFGMGIGSRDLALGGANVAVCDFATAPYWNPSRLARSEQYSVTGFHTRMFDTDVSYQYVGIVIPTLDWGGIGFGVTRLGIDGIEKRDASNLLLDTISDERLGLRIGYGRAIGSLDVGVSVSLETHSLDTYRATSTPGLDIAATKMVTSPFRWCENLSITLVGRNVIAPSMRLVDESVKTPFELHVGLSSKVLLSHESEHSIEVTGGFSKAENALGVGSLGLEYSLFDILKLRGSYREDQFSTGAGIAYRGISFDYALVDRQMGALHMISLSTSIGKSVSERRTIRAQGREAAFNRQMSDRLAQKNAEQASLLLEEGKRAQLAGDLISADANLDRALFLARGAGIDTSSYVALLAQVRLQIEDAGKQEELTKYVDSARARLAVSDYPACQYFASMALALDSTSDEAKTLQNKAVQATADVSRQDDFIRRQVWFIDSLISYGEVDQALSAARSLNSVLGQYPQAQTSLRKAEFEYYRAEAEKELSAKAYAQSLALLDSALVRLPGHSRCLELQRICKAEIRATQSATKIAAPVIPELSRDVLKQVQNTYGKAQDAFNRGDLTQAIANWEEVEHLAPGYQSVREYLLRAYRFVGIDLYGQNRLSEALQIWDKALKIAPENSEIAAYARRTRNEIEKLKALSYDN